MADRRVHAGLFIDRAPQIKSNQTLPRRDALCCECRPNRMHGTGRDDVYFYLLSEIGSNK